MIKELIKEVILILFLLGVMLLIGSCGTRRMHQTKDIERVNIQTTAVEKEHSTLSSSVRMYEAREVESESSEIYDNETVEENYCIGTDGKPYLCSKTTTKNMGNKNTRGSEKAEATKDEKLNQTIDSEKKTEIDLNLVDKDINKQTEADKTVATNFGGAEWLFAGVVVVVAAVFVYFRTQAKTS